MNKLFAKVASLTLGLALVAGAGVALASNAKEAKGVRAADAILTLVPDQESTGSSASTYITSPTTYSYGGVSWTMNQWNPSSLQVKTNQSNASSEFNFYTGLFAGKVKSVVMTFTALTLKSETDTGMYLVSQATAFSSLPSTGGDQMTWDSSAMTLSWSTSSDGLYAIAFYQNGKVATGTNKIASIAVTYESGTTPVETHSVIFNANGDNVTGMPSNLTGKSGAVSLSDVAEPSREGYTFQGWSLTTDGAVITEVTVSTADVNVYAIWEEIPEPSGDTIVDEWEVATFDGAPSSYATDGTEYAKAGPLTGVNYYATGINSSGNIRGNKGANNGNFNLRNSTTFDGYYMSKLLITETGGTMDPTTTNRSVLFVADSVFPKIEDATVPTATSITANETSAGTTLTFENSDESVSYFQFYSLKTSGTCTNASIQVTWTKTSGGGDLKTMTIEQSGAAAEGASYDWKAGTYTFEAYEESAKVSGVSWSVSNEAVATINASTGALTPVKPGNVIVYAEAEGYKKASAAITINAGDVSSVVVTGSMSKTAYYVGETWSHDGLTATVNYSTGYSHDGTEDVVWSYDPASPAKDVTSVVATATIGGKSGNSAAQAVTVTKTNPLQVLYSLADNTNVDVYGIYVGFADGTGPVIMDGEYGIVSYSKTADVSSYVAGTTVLHITGKMGTFNGLRQIASPVFTVVTEDIPEIDTPVVYAAKGGETAEYASRLTTVTGVATCTKNDFSGDAGANDITMSFAVGDKTVQVFYKKAAQTADTDAYAAMKTAVESGATITVKGFTGWYNGFQVQMNGIVSESESYTAEDFAQDLLDATDAVCSGWKEGDNNHDALVPVWNALQDDDKYPSLPAAQKQILADAEADEDGETINQALARYEYLCVRYGLAQFIAGHDNLPTERFMPVTSNEVDSNAAITIITIIAVTSISAIAVLLVIKKRKTY